jgi:hypothetical protein
MAAIGAATLAAMVIYEERSFATLASGFTGTTVAMGRFSEIDNFNYLLPLNGDPWLLLVKTKGQSDLYVQSNVWQPGGTTGWHTHPGASWILVTAGTVTVYEGDDKECKPKVYTTGMGLLDPGGDHVHVIRNEGSVTATSTTVQLIAGGAARRIDAPDPGNCVFRSSAATAAVATPKNVTVVTREIQLDGTGSTSVDGMPLQYLWSIPPGKPSAAIGRGNTATPIVQFGTIRGEYTFQLTVTDSTGATATDTVTVRFTGI